MPRRNAKGREERKREKRQGLALQLLVIGTVIGVAPWLLSHPLAQAFRAAAPFGIVMMAMGGILLWWFSRTTYGDAPPTSDAQLPKTVLDVQDPVSELLQRPLRGDSPKTSPQPRTRPLAWSAQVLHDIEWRRFEVLVEAFFAQAGFATRSQTHGADGGVDIWLTLPSQPATPVGIVQCKQWSSKRVGVDKVRELRGVMAAHGISRGHLVTTSGFTSEAEAFAQANGIALLDAKGLLAQIQQRAPEQQQALLDVALEGEYWRPTCVSCGVKLVERQPRTGGAPFWGCPNYPKCRTTMPLRGAR